jgi:hypothetical protein
MLPRSDLCADREYHRLYAEDRCGGDSADGRRQ